MTTSIGGDPRAARRFLGEGVQLGAAGAPLLAGALVLAVAMLVMTSTPVGVFYDDGQYVILAKALASGEGYRYLNIPGHPAATHFPPAYPAFLAVLWWLWPSFPENVVLFRFATAVLFAIAAAGWTHFAISRLRLDARVALAGVIGFTLGIPVVLTTNVLFSEPLFLALLWPAILAAERALSEDEETMLAPVAAGLLCGVLALVRTIGIAGGVTLILLLARRRWRAGLLFALALGACLLPWQIWTAAHLHDVPSALSASYGAYLPLIADTYREVGGQFFIAVVRKNAGELARPFMILFAPANSQALRLLLLLPLGVALALGVRRCWRAAPSLVGFLAAYLAIVVVWPFAPDRFIWGVWPLIGVLFTLGVVEAAPWRGAGRARWPRLALLVGLAVAAVGYLRYNAYGYAKGWYDSAQRSAAESSQPAAQWIARHGAPGDVVATDADPLIYLYTGRQAVPNVGWALTDYLERRPVEPRRAETRAIMDRYRPRFVVVTSPAAPAAQGVEAMMRATPSELRLIEVLPGGGAVFEPIWR
jgi:hypothetical protein